MTLSTMNLMGAFSEEDTQTTDLVPEENMNDKSDIDTPEKTGNIDVKNRSFYSMIPRGVKIHPRGEEMRRLVIAAKNGDREARSEMLTRNMRLVAKILSQHLSRYRLHPSSAYAFDLFQEGCEGVLKAIDRFDLELGLEFSTYATWWIKQSIDRGAETTIFDDIRRPVHVHLKSKHLRSAFLAASKELGRLVHSGDIPLVARILFEKYGVDTETTTSKEEAHAQGYQKYQKRLEKYVRESLRNGLLMINTSSVSSDSTLDRSDESNPATLGDMLTYGEDNDHFEQDMSNTDVRELVCYLLGDLREKELVVFRSRLIKDITLEETGALPEMQVTRERVRQIQSAVVKKLTHRVYQLNEGQFYSTKALDPDLFFDETLDFAESVKYINTEEDQRFYRFIAMCKKHDAIKTKKVGDKVVVVESSINHAHNQRIANDILNTKYLDTNTKPIVNDEIRRIVTEKVKKVINFNTKSVFNRRLFTKVLCGLLLDGLTTKEVAHETSLSISTCCRLIKRWRYYCGSLIYELGSVPAPFETPNGEESCLEVLDPEEVMKQADEGLKYYLNRRRMNKDLLEKYLETEDFKIKHAIASTLDEHNNKRYNRAYGERTGLAFQLKSMGYHNQMIAAITEKSVETLAALISRRMSLYQREDYLN